MRFTWNILLVFILAMCSASVVEGQKQKTLPNASPKLSQGWISGSLMMKPGNHFSPDGKYYVAVASSPSEGDIQIFFSHSRRHTHLSDSNLLERVDPGGVNGLAWLPRRPHTLVFASYGDPGYAMLALWNGGQSVHMLHKVSEAQNDEFKLFAVSSDGKSLIYGWLNSLSNDSPSKPMRQRYLRLSIK